MGAPDTARLARRSLMLGAGFAATAGVAALVTPRRHEQTLGHARLADIIPNQVGPWAVQPDGPMVLPEDDQPTEIYDQVLTRTFAAPALPAIMLLVAYGAAQSGLMKVHRPEVCYASSGFEVRNDHPVDIPLPASAPIAANTFQAQRENRDEQVLYWTRISTAFPRDLTAERLILLRRGLAGVIPDGVLVRSSTLDADLNAGQSALIQFCSALVASSAAAGRALLVGGPRRPARG